MDKRAFVLVLIFAAALVAVFAISYIPRIELGNKAELMLSDPVNYVNVLEFQKLSEDDKRETDSSMEAEFRARCSQLNAQCNTTFLATYLKTKRLLGSDIRIPSGMDTAFSEAYSRIKKIYEKGISPEDLDGCLTDYLAELCLMDYLNQGEKDYWAQKILDVERNNSPVSYVRARYFTECMNITNVSGKPSIGEKICYPISLDTTLPLISCLTYKYLYVKRFCNYHITADEISFAEQVVNYNYTLMKYRVCQLTLLDNLPSFRASSAG